MNLNPRDEQTFSRVLRVVKQYVRPPLDQESLAQEVIYEHEQSGKPITKVAIRHRCFDLLRKDRTQKQHEEAYSLSDRSQSVPFDYTNLDELFCETQLTSDERTVILLYYAHELTLKEISRSLNLSVRQVSDLQWSGLERLKETARRIYG